MDYQKTALELIELSGGYSNIKAVGHCATRLRFTLVDKDAADFDAMKTVPGVLGVIWSSGQAQIIVGKEVSPLYNAAHELYEKNAQPATKTENKPSSSKKQKTWRDYLNDVIGFVAGAVSPMVPGLIGGGMLKVLLLLITYVVPAFKDGNTYMVMSWVANAPFYFMPIFVAYGAAKQLGSTPIYAMAGAASLLTPAFTTMVSNGEAVTLLNLPVKLVKYPQQLLPALLIALACHFFEKLLNKIVPGLPLQEQSRIVDVPEA